MAKDQKPIGPPLSIGDVVDWAVENSIAEVFERIEKEQGLLTCKQAKQILRRATIYLRMEVGGQQIGPCLFTGKEVGQHLYDTLLLKLAWGVRKSAPPETRLDPEKEFG